MKLICTQSDFNKNLSLVSRAIPSRPTHPILSNILLVADEDTQKVTLTAFDLSLGIRTSFKAQVEEGGTFTLPAKLLGDIISRLPDGEISLDDNAGDAIATITSASGKYTVRGMGSEEFPELPEIEAGEVINLPPEALIAGLKRTLFATSSDETKQVLCGVHLKMQYDNLEFAATDGHRLAVVEIIKTNDTEESEDEDSDKSAAIKLTIPARALYEIEKMITGKDDESIVLHLDQGQVIFEWENQQLTTRTLEGQYPNYRQLLPDKFERLITIERKSLLAAVQRIGVMADQKNNILKCSINADNQEVTLSVDAKDVGSGAESMPAQITGDSIEIAFNVKYLIDILKTAASTEVQIHINDDKAPVIFKPLDGIKTTFLVMPIQLRD